MVLPSLPFFPALNHNRSREFAIYKMKFSVNDAIAADCPSLAPISLAAFEKNPMVEYLARDVQPDSTYTYQSQQHQRSLETSSLNGLRFFKVVDDEPG